MDVKTHWEKVYKTKAPDAVSWYLPHLETSLALMPNVEHNWLQFHKEQIYSPSGSQLENAGRALGPVFE